MSKSVVADAVGAVYKNALLAKVGQTSLTVDEVRRLCPDCATLMVLKGLHQVRIDDLEMVRKAKAKKGMDTSDPGLFTRCMTTDNAQASDNPEAYCAAVHYKITGRWPAQDKSLVIKHPGHPDQSVHAGGRAAAKAQESIDKLHEAAFANEAKGSVNAYTHAVNAQDEVSTALDDVEIDGNHVGALARLQEVRGHIAKVTAHADKTGNKKLAKAAETARKHVDALHDEISGKKISVKAPKPSALAANKIEKLAKVYDKNAQNAKQVGENNDAKYQARTASKLREFATAYRAGNWEKAKEHLSSLNAHDDLAAEDALFNLPEDHRIGHFDI